MSEKLKVHKCPECGYKWKDGRDGSHSCCKELQKTIIRMKNKKKSFKNARKRMGEGLLDHGLYLSYQANIAMTIYDNRRKDGRLNHTECNEVAKKIIAIIWDVHIKE